MLKRSTVDKVISYIGLLLSAVLLAASLVLYFTHSFIHGEVSAQLTPQNITLPAKDTPAFTSLSSEDQAAVAPFAGQQVTTGEQAKVFANHYIGAHLRAIGDGKSYSQLSAEAMKDPTNTELAATVDTVFRGETLRGMLLNAYAFDSMATVARYVALGALIAGLLLIPLSLLGLRHARRASAKK